MPAKATSRRISRKPLYAEVVEGIREMIIGGRLTPGARLVESELCEMFGISRTPFREALKLLESEGLVVLKPNRGATVSVMTEQEITDLFELVASLERSAVELAVQRMDDKALAKLRKQHDRMMKLHAAHKRRVLPGRLRNSSADRGRHRQRRPDYHPRRFHGAHPPRSLPGTVFAITLGRINA